MVWTSGEPCTGDHCAALTLALRRGEIQIIEHGRWGPYEVIVRWTHPEVTPLYFLAELGDT
jgi:hypothetical protein